MTAPKTKAEKDQERFNRAADEARLDDFDFIKRCYTCAENAPDTPADQRDARNALYALANHLYQISRTNGMSWGDIFETSKEAMRDLWSMEMFHARALREAGQKESDGMKAQSAPSLKR